MFGAGGRVLVGARAVGVKEGARAVAIGAVLVIAALLTGFSLGSRGPVGSSASFDNVFWETRQADIFGQMIAILAGASAIVVFFKESEKQ